VQESPSNLFCSLRRRCSDFASFYCFQFPFFYVSPHSHQQHQHHSPEEEILTTSLADRAIGLCNGKNGTSLYSQASLKHLQLINYRRTLGPDEKKGYIDAILCLQALPAALSSTIPGAVSRFDDFVGLHISQMEKVHLNVCVYLPQWFENMLLMIWQGQFLPWHRYFTAVFEDSLRSHCGYTGGQP